jgi:hypothetical protein
MYIEKSHGKLEEGIPIGENSQHPAAGTAPTTAFDFCDRIMLIIQGAGSFSRLHRSSQQNTSSRIQVFVFAVQ